MCVKLFSFVINQRLYLLCQLKRQGLPLNCLDLVFDSLIMSKLLYASPSWSAVTSFRNYHVL